MIRKLLFTLLSFVGVSVYGQVSDWDWVSVPTLGVDPKEVYLGAHSKDSQGNIYCYYSTNNQMITFGDQIINNPAGAYKYFLVKYNSNGEVVWIRQRPANEHSNIFSIAIDASGNLYEVGNFWGNITLGTQTFTAENDNSYTDMFVAKYDSGGNVLWAKHASGTGDIHNMQSNGIVVDPSGNVYVSGHMIGDTFTFGNVTIQTQGLAETYLVKYAGDGTMQWVKNGVGTTHLGSECDLVCDSQGNVYLASDFSPGSITFDNFTLAGNGTITTYIIKFNPSGNVVWGRKMGGSHFTYALALAIDGGDNLYTTGVFNGYNSTFGSITLTNPGSYDAAEMYVAKFDHTNGDTIWAKSAGGMDYDYGIGLAVSSGGEVYVTGSFFSAQIQLGQITMANSGEYNTFLAKMDTSGNFIWTKQVGGSGYISGYYVILNPEETAAYLGGVYSGNAIFSNQQIFTSPVRNNFLSKYTLPSLPTETFATRDKMLYPNPASDFISISDTGLYENGYEILDVAGRVLVKGRTAAKIDISFLPNGIYTFSMGAISQKFIKE